MWRVTTFSPSAICSSMLTWKSEEAAACSATARLYSSVPASSLERMSWTTKSGDMNSSTLATLPLLQTSSKNLRTRALFFSSVDTGGFSFSLPTHLSLPSQHHGHDATRRGLAHLYGGLFT